MDRIQFRRDTLDNWNRVNPILLEGETGYVLDDPNRYKIGDGVHTWDQLPFRGFDGTIVHDTGDSENAVMSQKATSKAVHEILYDVSAHNDGAVFESLQALLSSSNLNILIPLSARHGGMSIRFIQGSEQSSDNKYIQYICTADSFTTNVTKWLRVNDLAKIIDLKNPVEYINDYYNIQSEESQRTFTVTPLAEQKHGYLRINGVSVLKKFSFCNSSWSTLTAYENIAENEIVDIIIPKNAPNIKIEVAEVVATTTRVDIELYYDSAENRLENLEDTTLKKVEQQLSSDEIKAVYNNLALFDEIPTSIISKGGWNTGRVTNITFDYDNTFEEGVAKLNITGITPKEVAFKNENGVILSETSYLYCIIPNGTKKITIYWSTPTGTAGQVSLLIYQYGSAITANYLLKNKVPEIETNIRELATDVDNAEQKIKEIDYVPVTSSSLLDVSSLPTEYGNIDNLNGEFSSHAYRLTSDYIPIKELEELYYQCAASDTLNYYMIIVHFYKVDRFSGGAEYLADTWYGTDYGKRNDYYIVPKGSNAVRITFGKFVSGKEVKIDKNEITSTNFAITSIFTDVFEDTNTVIKSLGVNEDLKINDYSAFMLGLGSRTNNLFNKNSILVKPIKVTPGEKYAVFCNMANNLYSYRVLFYRDNVNANVSDLEYVILGVQTTAGISGHFYSTFDVPVGVNYIRIVAIGDFNKSVFTPEMAAEGDFHIVNITCNKLVWSDKIASYIKSNSRYAQGFAVQNGYGFLGFSDGTIDVYEIATGTKVQSSISVPAPSGVTDVHLNSLNFMHTKYDSSDEFSILMCMPETNENHFGLRVLKENNTFSFQKVCDFAVPTVDTTVYAGSQMFFDDINKVAIQQNIKVAAINNQYTSGYDALEFKKFTYTGELTGTPVFTEVSDNTFAYPRIYPPQGGKIVNGRLYLVFGTDKKSSYIIGFDINKQRAVDVIDLRLESLGIDFTVEPQSFDFTERGIILAAVDGLRILHI